MYVSIYNPSEKTILQGNAHWGNRGPSQLGRIRA